MPGNELTNTALAEILKAVNNMEVKFEDRFSEIYELYHELSLDFNKFSSKHEAQELTFLAYADKVTSNCKAIQNQQRALDKLQIQFEVKADTYSLQEARITDINTRLRELETVVAGITGRIVGWSAAAGTCTAVVVALAQLYFKK